MAQDVKMRGPKVYSVQPEGNRYLIMFDGLVVGIVRFEEDVDAWFKARRIPSMAREQTDAALGNAVYRL